MPLKEKPETTVLVMLDSLRKRYTEIVRRNDADEIAAADEALWAVAIDFDLRRHKQPAVKLPRVRRVER